MSAELRSDNKIRHIMANIIIFFYRTSKTSLLEAQVFLI